MTNEPCYYRVSVKGTIIDDQGRVLLTRENNGKWELLGGGLEHGESPKQGLKREIYEEAGLKVLTISDAPKYFFTFARPNRGTFAANIVYQITLEDLNFIPSEECQELRFFTIDEMKKLDSYGNLQKLTALLEGR